MKAKSFLILVKLSMKKIVPTPLSQTDTSGLSKMEAVTRNWNNMIFPTLPMTQVYCCCQVNVASNHLTNF